MDEQNDLEKINKKRFTVSSEFWKDFERDIYDGRLGDRIE